MALEGSLKDFGFADILQLIFFQRKTGVLTIEGRLDKIRLLFIDGNITGAESKRRSEANRLGKILVKKGVLSEELLQSILQEQKNTNTKLGNLIVRKGIVEKADIEEILENQIKETVIQIFNWKDGTYEFTPTAVPVDKEIPLSIDTQHLLMEGLRIVDEWTTIEGKITLDTVFMKTGIIEAEQPEEEREILELIDGENDVSTIIDISGKDDYSVSKVLVSLLDKGIIASKEAKPLIAVQLVITEAKPPLSYTFLPLIVIIIAFVISLLPVFTESGDILKNFITSKDINELRLKIEAHKFSFGEYPADLNSIIRKSDQWHQPYIYKNFGEYYTLSSSGPDKISGTPDDIY
ncbi:MAG: DUF4388 domain-containing protein [Nitrospirae bacterium]|nr:DUF4388 domain-containing protein [Nitrospirota bacterium]